MGVEILASNLQICMMMKRKRVTSAVYVIGLTLLLGLAYSTVSRASGSELSIEQQDQQPGAAVGREQTIARFEGRVKEYARMREMLEEKLPKLPKDATPEQIKAHKTSFEQVVRKARVGAKQGDLFSPDIANYIRTLIRTEFQGQKLKELREEIMEAETQGVPVRVNYTYPESKELTQIPPTLLLKLPQLPKQVRYRFVGPNMLLVDRENGLIVDYMTNALP